MDCGGIQMKHRETYYTGRVLKIAEKLLGAKLFRIEGLTTLNGMPDIIGYNLKNGKFIGIEVKIAGNKLSELQKRILNNIPNAYIAWIYKDYGVEKVIFYDMTWKDIFDEGHRV
jgi:hypothetical protein